MSKGRFLSLSPCRRALPVGISGDMRIRFKGMMTGMIDATAVTSKDFMLTRTCRVSSAWDKTSVAASVANLTGKNISGTVSFILFDPMTEKVISTQKQKFSVEAGRSTGVSFFYCYR